MSICVSEVCVCVYVCVRPLLIGITLPEGSASLRTKYLLESDTGSTATPGWASTGHIANSSPTERFE